MYPGQHVTYLTGFNSWTFFFNALSENEVQIEFF